MSPDSIETISNVVGWFTKIIISLSVILLASFIKDSHTVGSQVQQHEAFIQDIRDELKNLNRKVDALLDRTHR